jgi:hypothetical protein
VPLADLSRLEHGLDSIFTTYGVNRRLPLYLTEYGYETNPPNPYRGVPLRVQAEYLNQGDYLAWKDPRVRSLTQFLLYDSAPDTHYRPGSVRYWSTFQTGLLFLDGRRKPAFAAYRLPIYLPKPAVRRGEDLTVWGMLRPAPAGTRQQAMIVWQGPSGQRRTLATARTSDSSRVLTVQVQVPASGTVRIAWKAPGGTLLHSRAVTVRVS